MAHFNGLYLVFASIGLILCNVATAQISSTTLASTVTVSAAPNTTVAAPLQAVSCENATPATVNGTLLLGTWFEAARKPIGGGSNTEECVQLVVALNAGKVSLQMTYSIDPNTLWINQTTTNTLTYNTQASGSEVFDAVFTVTNDGINTTIKILQTDYSSFALVCAYTATNVLTTTVAPSSSTTVSTTTVTGASTISINSTIAPTSTDSPTTSAPVSESPAGAFILTRERQINATQLASLKTSALTNFTDFNNISTVTQDSKCYYSGAASTVPALAMVMAVVYSLLKFVH